MCYLEGEVVGFYRAGLFSLLFHDPGLNAFRKRANCRKEFAQSCLPVDGVLFQVQATKQTFSSFDDMLKNSGVPVLVDFYAVWYAFLHTLMDVSRTRLQ